MTTPSSIQHFLKKSILKKSIFGFVLLAVISIIVSFFIAKYKISTYLQEIARSTVQAYRSHILSGEVKTTEMQIRDLLRLGSKENSVILDKNFVRIYKENSTVQSYIDSACANVGEICFNSLTGPAQIIYPIYFDEQQENLFGYLYISKSIRIDWIFIGIVFSIFALGYLVLFLSISKMTQAELLSLSESIQNWANQIQNNPKDSHNINASPFLELVPLQKSLSGLNKKIEEYEKEAGHKAKINLLRGIAHDILTPMSQIQMNFAALELQLKNDQTSKLILNEISDSLKRASAIALQVKQLNSGSNSKQITASNLNTMINQELESLQKMSDVRNKAIKISTVLADEEILTSLTQPELSRILLNLVQNAAQASDAQSEVEISTSVSGTNLKLQVTDTGSGIPFHLQHLVFEPDFTTKPSTGTGLGLSVIRHIIEQHSGTVTIDSNEGVGTKVLVTMPLVKKELSKNKGGSHVLQTING